MFVLQDCSICLEDFDVERSPHTIPCGIYDFLYRCASTWLSAPFAGHVFCQPCLESLAFPPSCPQCRTSFVSGSIHKVVCAFQSPPPSPPTPTPTPPPVSISASEPSEAEATMWQAIKSAIESEYEQEQRQLIVMHNQAEDMRDEGMSEVCLYLFCVRTCYVVY